jgi:hypothetical protein
LLVKENLTQIEAGKNEPQSVATAMGALKNSLYKKGDIRYQNSFDEAAEEYSAAKLDSVKEFYKPSMAQTVPSFLWSVILMQQKSKPNWRPCSVTE